MNISKTLIRISLLSLSLPPLSLLLTHQRTQLIRSAIKSVTAGIAGAALTNPLDVIRNEYVHLFEHMSVCAGFICQCLLMSSYAFRCIYGPLDLLRNEGILKYVFLCENVLYLYG